MAWSHSRRSDGSQRSIGCRILTNATAWPPSSFIGTRPMRSTSPSRQRSHGAAPIGATAGVPARSTPESDPTAAIPGRAFAGAVLTQTPDVVPADDNAVVIALGTAADDDVSRLRAGEATSLVLLTATALGLASCPITEPLEIPETRAAVRADVFGADEYPQVLLRIGWAPVNADPLPSTPRLALSEVVAQLDGSSFS